MKKIFIICSMALVLSFGAKFVLAGAADLPGPAMKPNVVKPAFKPMAEVPYYGDFKYNKVINTLPPKFEGEPVVLFKYTNAELTAFSVKIDLNITNGDCSYLWHIKVANSSGGFSFDEAKNYEELKPCAFIRNENNVPVKFSCELNQSKVKLQDDLTFKLWNFGMAPNQTEHTKIVDLSAFEKELYVDMQEAAAGALDIAEIGDGVLAQTDADQSLDDVPGSGVYIAAPPPDGSGSVDGTDDNKGGSVEGTTECTDPNACVGLIVDPIKQPLPESDGGCSIVAGASPSGLNAIFLLTPAILALALRRKKA